MYIMNCEICHKEYEAERSTAKYCSAECEEKLAFQEKALSVPEDYTRKMVEDRLKDFKLNGYAGDDFIPNWYKLGFSSRNHCLQGIK